MAIETEAKEASPFFVFQDANSQKVFWGQLISQACDKLMSVGMIWVLSSEFSPKWVPWFIAFGALPHFLLATISGHWIARWGALKTVIWADIFRGALFVFCAWVASFTKADSHLLTLLMISAIVSNIAGALFNPAILSLPVSMMEEGEKRDKLTALIDSCFSFGSVLGPLCSALAYAWTGLIGLLAINGLSYFFSAALALGVKLQEPAALVLTHSTSARAELDNADRSISRLEGGATGGADPDRSNEQTEPNSHNRSNEQTVSSSHSQHGSHNNGSVATPPLEKAKTNSISVVMKKQPVIAGMLLTFLMMNFFLAPLMVFMPWYVKNTYHMDIMGLARLEAFMGIGTVIGGLLLSVVKIPGATWKRVCAFLVLMALSYLSFTFSQNIWAGCISVFSLGFFLALANVVLLTFFQSAPQADDVPVVMGMVNLISVASLPISMGIIGAFIEHVNVPQFAAICAAVVVGIAMLIRFIPGIQRIP